MPSVFRFKFVNNASSLQGNQYRRFSKSKYTINHELLNKGIISHQHAWFWGMFLSDGSLHGNNNKNGPKGIRWDLKYDCYGTLESLRNIVNSSHPIFFLCFQITSANFQFLAAIQKVISQQCLNTSSEYGQIYTFKSANASCLLYARQDQLLQIGKWMYPSSMLTTELFLKKKYQRFQLLQRLLDPNTRISDRLSIVNAYVEKEQARSAAVLKKLIEMSMSVSDPKACPEHYRFRKNFYELSQ